jgi:mannosyltransferase
MNANFRAQMQKWTQTPLITGVVILLALLLRLLFIDRSGLWSDELFSVYYSKLNPHFLWNEGLRIETNPPLYYTFLHYWLETFGASEIAVRLPSVLFSLGTVGVVIAIGKKLSGPKAGLVAGFLAAVMAHQLLFAQEARAYALVSLAVCIAIYGFIRFLREEKHFLALLFFVFGATLSIHAHNTGFIFVVACNLSFVLWLVLKRKWDWTRVAQWSLANLLIIALTIPLLAPMFTQVNSANLAWIPHPTWKLVVSVFTQQMLGSNIPFSIAQWLGILFFTILAVQSFRQRLRLEERVVYIALPLCFVAVMYLVSLYRPILLPRTALWISIPICLLTGTFLAKKRWDGWKVLAASAAALIFTLGGVAYYSKDTKEDWRGIADQLRTQVNSDYTPVFSEFVPSYVIEHYAPGLTTKHPKRLEYDHAAPATAEISISDLYNRTDKIFLKQFSRMLDRSQPLFLLMRKIDLDSFADKLAKLPRKPDVILKSKGGISVLIWR